MSEAWPQRKRRAQLKIVPKLSKLPACSVGNDDTVLKREKLRLYEKAMSEVISEFLYIGGKAVAQDLEALRARGITHIINCGTIVKEFFVKDCKYLALAIPDDGHICDLSWGLHYRSFDFIEDAWKHGGRVLIHCASGVSRSCAFAVAYLMWRQKKIKSSLFLGGSQYYSDNLARVKLVRPICDPNAAFETQLTVWAERRQTMSQHLFCGLFRAAYMPLLIDEAKQAGNCNECTPVMKLVKNDLDNNYCSPPLEPSPALLDPRTAFLILVYDRLALWIGSTCPADLAECARTTAQWLSLYDGAPELQFEIYQGDESNDFWSFFPPHCDRSIARRAHYDNDLINIRKKETVWSSSSLPEHNIQQEHISTINMYHTERSHLYEFSSPDVWNQIIDYDHNDLCDDSILLLLRQKSQYSESGAPSFMWVGAAVSDFDLSAALRAVDEQAVLSMSASTVRIIRAGAEPDIFWTIFEAGY